MRTCVLALCIASTACGEQDPPPLPDADLGELCGGNEPVELLTLGPMESASTPIVVEERIVVGLEHWDDSGQPTRRTLSLSACGGDPRAVLDSSGHTIRPRSPSAPWLVWTAEEEIWWIDPTGTSDARFVARGRVLGEHDGAPIVFVEPYAQTPGMLARMRIEAGTFVLEPIVERVTMTAVQGWPTADALPPSIAFVRTEDAELLEVDLATERTTVVAAGVQHFSVGDRGRFVSWYPERDPESESLLRPWYLLDRHEGRYVEHHEETTNLLIQPGVAYTFGNQDPTYAWMLPGLEPHVLRGTWLWSTDANSPHVVGIQIGPTEIRYWVFDTPRAEPRLVYSHASFDIGEVRGDDIWIVDRDRLRRVPLDGSAPETLQARAGAPTWLPDGRFLTVRPDTGELILVDGDSAAHVHDEVHRVHRLIDGSEAFFEAGPVWTEGGHALYRVVIAP